MDEKRKKGRGKEMGYLRGFGATRKDCGERIGGGFLKIMRSSEPQIWISMHFPKEERIYRLFRKSLMSVKIFARLSAGKKPSMLIKFVVFLGEGGGYLRFWGGGECRFHYMVAGIFLNFGGFGGLCPCVYFSKIWQEG